MTLAPESYQEYLTELGQKLNALERLTDRATGIDDRLDILARIQIEQLRLLKQGLITQPPPIGEVAPYSIREYSLDSERTENEPEEIKLSGNYLAAFTNGTPQNIKIRLNSRTADVIPLSRFNHLNVRFERLYLSNTVQERKNLTLFIGQMGTVSTSGSPVWAVDEEKPTIYALTDMAELAARLKSVNTFDRRGNVIWMDDFEDTINRWESSLGSGSGGAVEQSSERARSGAFSCKLTCPDNLASYAKIAHYSGYPVLSSIGSEISFTIPSWPYDARQFTFGLILDDGTNWMVAEVYWDMSDSDHRNHTLSVAVPTTPFTAEFDKDFFLYYENTYGFHTAKLVADFVNRKYLRFILDHVTYDLSEYNLSLVTGPLVSLGVHLACEFTVYNNDAGTNPFCYVDDAIITQNEPANPAL